VSAFFDTNILLYAQEAGRRGDAARAVFAAGGQLSVQVLNEFVAVSRRKHGRDWRQIEDAIDDVLALVEPPLALTPATCVQARMLARDHGFSFYDALIVAAAIESGCDTLYSEDMQHGRVIAGLTIVNPFAAPPP
jgi:predicted nucleic acid-binding protein